MSKFWKFPAVAALALGTLFISAPPASAMVRGGVRVGFGHAFYGRGWYGGGWGLGWGGWWGPGWYAGWGPGYYWGPGPGQVKIATPDKSAAVFVDGGYVGPVAKAKKFPLRPGNNEVQLRDPNGQIVYDQEVNIIRGRTVKIDTGALPPPAPMQQPPMQQPGRP